MNTIAVLLILGGIHGFLLAAALSSMKKGRRRANRILAALLVLFSLNIILHTIAHTSPGQERINIPSFFEKLFEPLFYFFTMALLFGPLLLFYVRAITATNFRIAGKQLLHFVPASLAFVIFTLTILLNSDAAGTNEFHQHASINGAMAAVSWLIGAHLIAYIFAAVRAILQYTHLSRSNVSPVENAKLRWLRFFIIGFSATWLAAFLIEQLHGGVEAWNYNFLLVSIFMYAIGYQGLRRPEVFSEVETRSLANKKYEKSTLTPQRAEEILKRLQTLMPKEKPHLKTDLTLNALAKMLAASSHHLSQVLNEKTGQNFFEFINGHRVEEAKRLITDPANENLTLAEIGFQAGFNSISSFNTAFKKHAGLTPSTYRQSNA